MSNTISTDGLDAIDFPKIIDRLLAEADTPMGRERIGKLSPQSNLTRLQSLQDALRDAAGLVASGEVSLAGAVAVGALGRIAAKGGVLAGETLWQIVVTLRIVDRLLRKLKDGTYPSIQEKFAEVRVPDELLAALVVAVREDGALNDQASAALATIRRQLREESRALDVVFERILSMPSWAPYLQDRVVTVRLGRRVVPVKIEFRNKVRGLVHDQSASGQTVFVEPIQAVQHQNRITMLEHSERDEMERILAELSAQVGVQARLLRFIEHRLGWLDEIFAKSRLGASMRASMPKLGGDTLSLIEARHPLLAHPVPITVALSPEKPVLVVTGPNTGGKTVSLKTIGLMVAMALSGMLVPCRDGSTIPVYERLWLDIGDDQSIEQNLSTFSGHLSHLIPMVREAAQGHLCLIDEIGSGTDPDEGAVLAEAMIESLYQRSSQVVVTTHLGRLKLLAYRVDGIQNAQVEFDRETLSPTYRLLIGFPGSSHALYVAERLGMPKALLDQARGRMAPEAEAMKRALEDLEAMNAQLRGQLGEIEQRERNLAMRDAAIRQNEERIVRERTEMRDRGLNAWRRQLDELTRKFNEISREVRHQDAHERQQAMESLRETFRLAQEFPTELRTREGSSGSDQGALAMGDWVMAEGFRDAGRIVGMTERSVTVEVGALRLKLPVTDVHKTRPTEPARTPAPRRGAAKGPISTVGTELDLRGLTVDDALYACDRYLEEAVFGNVPWVRIIHGKGTGALRKAIQKGLADDPRIVQYRLGGPGEGGDGVTVAYLEEPQDL